MVLLETDLRVALLKTLFVGLLLKSKMAWTDCVASVESEADYWRYALPAG